MAVSRYLLKAEDPFSAVGAWWEGWALHAHVLAGPGLVFAVGFIYRRHVLRKLRDPRAEGRRSGVALGIGLALAVGSGYLVQVLVDDRGRAWTGIAHLAVGLALFLLYPVHVRLGRASEETG